MRLSSESGSYLTRLEEYEEAVFDDGITEALTNRLPEGIRGVCVKNGAREAIFLSKAENGSKAAELETLSHERCHLIQGALYRLSSSEAEISLAERRATAASYKELLPLQYVINALFRRKMGFAEIALEAEVTEGFARRAVEWYSGFEEFEEAKRASESSPW